MIRPGTTADLDDIVAVLVHGNDAPYDVARVAAEKCFEDGFAGSPVVRVYDDSGIRGVSVTCGRFLRIIAVDRDYRGRGIGSALVAEAEQRAHVVFAEGGNYFTPGVVEDDVTTRKFFRNRGYIESRWTWNLETDQLPMDVPDGVRRAGNDERERVLAFIEQEFGAIWRFECGRAFDRETPAMFIIEEDGAIKGFAAHDINNVGLGFFGPTGVAKSERGRGFGRQLLVASLADMRALGYTRAVIPWTDALDFYRKSCGAEVTHKFVTLSKERRLQQR